MRGFPMVALLLAVLTATPGTAPTPPPATLIKAARLIDPRTGTALSPAAVLIEDGKITRVGTPARVQSDAPATPKVVDRASAALLPGLIDSHTMLLDVIVPQQAQ